MSTKTCDYAGNGGYLEAGTNFSIPNTRKLGAIPLVVSRLTPERVKSSEIRDGMSNTILVWESAGKEWFYHDNGKLQRDSWDNWHARYEPIEIWVNENNGSALRCNNFGSIGYVTSWAGVNRFRLRVWDDDGLNWGPHFSDPSTYHRTINVTNSYRSPFSFHSTVCLVSNADGSVHSLVETIDAQVMIALSSRFGGESVELP